MYLLVTQDQTCCVNEEAQGHVCAGTSRLGNILDTPISVVNVYVYMTIHKLTVFTLILRRTTVGWTSHPLTSHDPRIETNLNLSRYQSV